MHIFEISELPTTSISLENGTTITIPILPGTQIDVAAGTIPVKDEEKDSQNDAEITDDVEEDTEEDTEEDSNESEMQSDKEPPESSTASVAQTAAKPNARPNHNPYPNRYVPYPNFAFDPNAPQFSQPPNFPQSQYYSHPTQFHPFPNAPPHTLIVKSPILPKTDAPKSNQEKNSKDDEPRGDVSESENQSSTGSSASISLQKNQEPSKNQIPSNYMPYFNYYNTFNPNQYYPSNVNGPNGVRIGPNYQAQYPNQFNPQYYPYNFQPPPSQPQPQNHYANSQLSSNRAVLNPRPNRKKQKVKHRPNDNNENQSTTESNAMKTPYNRSTQPSSHAKIKPTHSENSHITEKSVENTEVMDADKDIIKDE